MNSLEVVNIFIVLLYLCILVSLTSASELGISSCRYLGEMEEDGKKCHEDVVKIEKLPKNCSSFVYLGVVCKENMKIEPNDPMFGLERLKSLIDCEDKAHPVFLFYSHSSIDNFYDLLFESSNHSIVGQNLQFFLSDYPVKGLILHGVDQFYLNDILSYFPDVFIAYINTIKDMNPNLEIGLYLSARSIVGMEIGFDFSKINSLMDFFLIEFVNFNVCSDDFLHSGITPMDSSIPNVAALNKFAAVIDSSTIEKEKIYFEFLISPMPKPEEMGHFNSCEISYNEYCENEDDIISKWCADDTDILYKKGAFTKKYAKGFVGSYIDLVDRDDKCGCGKYATFDMMLNGFNGQTDPKNCKALEGH